MTETYTCPMHPEVTQNKPGRCPKCGMSLVRQSDAANHPEVSQASPSESYRPLVVILSLILLASFVVTGNKYATSGFFDLRLFVQTFMTGFFLIFAGFKLIDLSGFAQGYSTYDLLAKRWFTYGYIYPFIELFFGLAMLVNWSPAWLLLVEVFIMSFSGLGVALKLARHEKFQCACLGTFLKVPLTKVTLIEDFGMAALALVLYFLS